MDVNAVRDAAMNLRWAAEGLRDYAVLKSEGVERDDKLYLATENIRHAARRLGLQVVPVISAQQAHEHMIALRRAEDGDVTGQVLR